MVDLPGDLPSKANHDLYFQRVAEALDVPPELLQTTYPHPWSSAMVDRPSVGRMVHYVSAGSPIEKDGTQRYPSTCRAAIITEVPPGGDVFVSLFVMNPTGIHTINNVPYNNDNVSCTWHWPERV